MLRIATTQLWVHDQDAALDFWTTKVGMEVRSDVTVPEMGDFRWLTVGVPGQPEVSIVLMAVPGPPMTDAATSRQIADLVGKGFAGTVFLTTDDCQKSCQEKVSAKLPLRSSKAAIASTGARGLSVIVKVRPRRDRRRRRRRDAPRMPPWRAYRSWR